MFFNKNNNNNRMVDVRELQKRGVVKIPKQRIDIPTSREGFVELGETNSTIKKQQTEAKSNADFFGFIDNPTKPTTNNDKQQISEDKQLRAQDSRITNLDNKIYKLEQRIELLEKKLDVNQSNNPNPIGW